MDAAERGAPDFQWKNKYDNASPVDSPSTATLQLVAATLPHEAEEQLRNQKLEETEVSCEG